jgi:23S rRNA pseudouridine1911/1915/1917 synthase
LARQNFSIVFENNDFVAINKASGVLTIPDREQSEPSLKDMLKEKYAQIFTVHRLDRDTSGLVLFAKNESSHKFLNQLFEDRKVDKFYAGIVIGKPAQSEGMIDAPIAEHQTLKGQMLVHSRGKLSQTAYEVVRPNKHFSLLYFQLLTGRTHQIRVHCKNIGHPLACDPIYGDGKPILLSAFKKKFKLSKSEDEERPIISRLALHSHRLQFTNENGEQISLEAPVPKEFTALMTQLEKLG